jgi:hypothetical protein
MSILNKKNNEIMMLENVISIHSCINILCPGSGGVGNLLFYNQCNEILSFVSPVACWVAWAAWAAWAIWVAWAARVAWAVWVAWAAWASLCPRKTTQAMRRYAPGYAPVCAKSTSHFWHGLVWSGLVGPGLVWPGWPGLVWWGLAAWLGPAWSGAGLVWLGLAWWSGKHFTNKNQAKAKIRC